MKSTPASVLSVLVVLGAACGSEDVDPDAGVRADAGAATSDAGQAVDAGPQACESWLIEYSLEGSTFEIRNTPFGAGDAVNTVGPGRVQLRFPGAEGGPEAGAVSMVQFQLQMMFDVAMIETDVEITSGPIDCGVAQGTATSSVVGWSTPIAGYHSEGFITCRAGEFLCGAAGRPEDEPVAQNSTHDQPLMPFVFEGEGEYTRFSMREVQVPNEDPGDTFLTLQGRQLTRRCVPLPADCE